MMRNFKRFLVLFFGTLFLLLEGGCGKTEGDTKLVLYTGFKKDEVFRIETMSCMLPEIMVYLTNTQDQYESVFGKEIWKTDMDGMTLEENIKETVLAQLAQTHPAGRAFAAGLSVAHLQEGRRHIHRA